MSVLGAITSLVGGALSSSATRDANAAAARNQALANDAARRNSELEREYQERFAKNGVRWRVADAQAAGVHPLYALGGNFASYSPQSFQIGAAPVAADTGMASGVAAMGQDIGRAINATRTSGEKADAFQQTYQALQLQNMGLQNDLLASQIKRMQVNANPSFPTTTGVLPPIPEASTQEERPLLQIGGLRIKTDPSTSNMAQISDRYGDEGLASILGPIAVGWNDLMATSGGNPIGWLDRQTALPIGNVVPSPSQVRAGMKRGWYPR